MDCKDKKVRKLSKKKFHKAKSLEQFLELWSKFYNNEICIPTYYNTFVGAGDNPDATFEVGKKFQDIVKHGIIPTNYQPNSLKDLQKGYINMFVPNELVDYLSTYINRYPGYVAFWNDIADDFVINGLVVTYDPDEKEREVSQKVGVFMGDPFSMMGYAGGDDYDFIEEWINNNVKEDFNKDTYKYFTVVDTIPTEKPNRIIDIVLIALRDNK